VIDVGRPIAQVARELDFNESLFAKRVKAERERLAAEVDPGGPDLSSDSSVGWPRSERSQVTKRWISAEEPVQL
jgi:hypothetical protein